MAELADALDSKSSFLNGSEGSSPSSGTFHSKDLRRFVVGPFFVGLHRV